MIVSYPPFRITYRLHLLGLLDPLKMEREFVPKIRHEITIFAAYYPTRTQISEPTVGHELYTE
jgi:hypothetical protein